MAATTSHYSRYDSGLDSDEEEEERRLSKLHGEADDDATTSKRKRSTNAGGETKLTEEDAAAAKEFEDKMRRKKKPRPVLQAEHLKSAKGLIYARRSFPTSVKKFRELPLANKVRGAGTKSNKLAHKMNVASQINAAAQYSRSLMSNYNSFACELFPSLAVEDVFLKIEDLGSKKEVKDYLQLMREEFRREHLEGIYGAEKAKRILNELEYGLRAVHPIGERQFDSAGDGGEGAVMASRMGRAVNSEDEDEGMDTPPGTPPQRSPPKPVANPYAKKAEEATAAEGDVEKEGVEEAGNDVSNEDVAGADKEKGTEAGGAEDEEEEATFSVNGDDNANNAAASELAKHDDLMEGELAKSAVPENEDNVEKAHDSSDEKAEADPALEVNENKEAGAESKTQVDTEEATIEKQNGAESKTQDGTEEAIIEKQNDADAHVVPENVGEEGSARLAACSTGDAIDVSTVQNKSETPTQEVSNADKTQETLTLVGSQLDDVEMEYTQEDDERFSQVDDANQPAAEDAYSQEDGERFSQTQTQNDSHFSQDVKESQDDNEENTAEERFSQFTQPNSTMQGPIFEEDNDGNGTNNAEENAGTGDQLGQTMNTQLSLEY